ncbi:S8 family serine peptidase [bacterium]|nr:S8 family serine peptidase [bacterium]
MLISDKKHFVQSSLDYFFEVNDLEKRIYQLRRKFGNIFEGSKNEFPENSLQELLVLMIFYGTHLDVSEITNLKISDLEMVEMGRFKVQIKSQKSNKLRFFSLSVETSNVLKLFLEQKKMPYDSYLFLKEGKKFFESEIINLVQSYSNEKLLRQAGADLRLTVNNQYMVLPTSARLQAHPSYSGSGVCIAFIDSGFYPHPDLVLPSNRILKYLDITGKNTPLKDSNLDAWHGTMTTVSCAGNGYCSNGLYSGIARSSNLILLKVGENGGVDRKNIVKAIKWVVQHREEFNIKILNISLGSGMELSYRYSPIDEAAELAVQSGIVVVAAAGNDPLRASNPPANSPSVLTVGGFNDKNVAFEANYTTYHSQFGKTIDGILKPEITAPGTLVAAPILPETTTFNQAKALFYLKSISDTELKEEVLKHSKVLELNKKEEKYTVPHLRNLLETIMKKQKLIAPHYQHVDGTSFSAPIVSSVIAQMFEANSKLTPKDVREILISTAISIPHIPRERQGYGMINAFESVEAAEKQDFFTLNTSKENPKVDGNKVTFRWKGTGLQSVFVAGDFNQWDFRQTPLQKQNGNWETTVEIPLPGQYRYKFVLDGKFWVEDTENPNLETDSFGGVNSIFEVNEFSFTDESLDEIFKILHLEKKQETRESAVSSLDFTFRWQAAAKSLNVYNYYLKCLEQVIKHLETKLEAKKIQVIQLYNCGTVLRTKDFCVAIDFVTTRHVWGLGWKVSEELIEKITSKIDVLLTTQRLPDHLDLDVVRLLLEKNKPVLVPKADKNLISEECLGVSAENVKEFRFGKEKLKIIVHRAFHSFDIGKEISQVCYELEINKRKILFLADHDYTAFLDFKGEIDVLFVKLGKINPEVEPQTSQKTLFDKIKPRLVIPTHIAELGNPVLENQGSYDFAMETLQEAKIPFEILTWGETREFF